MSNAGLRTWMPEDVKKQKYVTSEMLNLYSNWGYQPISIPTLLDSKLFKKANFTSKWVEESKTFLVVDKDGSLLALRPDLTIPIAQAISSRYDKLSEPLRLYYSSSVFRHSGKSTDNSRKLLQTGVELIGAKASDNFSDFEILYLFKESAEQFKLQESYISITDSGIWRKAIELYPELGQEAYNLLAKGDLIAFKELVPEKHALRKLLLRDADNLKTLAEIEKALKLDLGYLKEILSTDSLKENLIFDPSLCPNLDYYTGIYFNLLIDGIGDMVAIGGRYDSLYQAFGKDFPAVGFAYYMPSFLKALQEQKLLSAAESKIGNLKAKSNWEETLKAAQENIKKGKSIAIK